LQEDAGVDKTTSSLARTMTGRRPWVREIASSRITYCVFLASLLVALRLVLFDYPIFFELRSIPNHDMSQGASFFATNMHAMRESGDLAWWNPATRNGYAQYYQGFLSPLAPTNGSLTHIIWAQLVRALGVVGVVIPEYYQYLSVTYVVLPFLAFFAFSLFCTLLLDHRAAVFLAAFAYAFSGIGLWNSAWFYFQEPATLFFLLAAIVHALQRPGPRALLLLLAAGLLQLTSTNYWTIYNSWFLIIILICYLINYSNQAVRLWRRSLAFASAHRGVAALFLGLAAATSLVWLVMLGFVYKEQAGNFIRTRAASYTVEQALARVKPLRWFTLELFDPDLSRAVKLGLNENVVHSARYLGAAFLPLLLSVFLCRWRRLERWLVTSSVCVFIVCLAPPFLLALWKVMPQMDRIVHLFYFYTQFLQILLVLLACASFDRLLRQDHDAATRRRLVLSLTGLSAVLGCGLMALFLFSEHYASADSGLQGCLLFAIICLLCCVFLLRMLTVDRSPRGRRAFVFVLLVVTAADLSRYFVEGCRADRDFTAQREWRVPKELPTATQAALRKPWRHPLPGPGSGSPLAENMPFRNEMWPENDYLEHRFVNELRNSGSLHVILSSFRDHPVRFYRHTARAPAPGSIPGLLVQNPRWLGEVLLLHGVASDRVTGPGPTVAASGEDFGYWFRRWGYNSIAVEVEAPEDGWLLLDRLHDPSWRFSIDGRSVPAVRADYIGTAVPIRAGRHRVRASFQPVSRQAFWPACWILEASMLALLIGARLSGQRTSRAAARTELIGRRAHIPAHGIVALPSSDAFVGGGSMRGPTVPLPSGTPPRSRTAPITSRCDQC
jgi:hypothetical protein